MISGDIQRAPRRLGSPYIVTKPPIGMSSGSRQPDHSSPLEYVRRRIAIYCGFKGQGNKAQITLSTAHFACKFIKTTIEH